MDACLFDEAILLFCATLAESKAARCSEAATLELAVLCAIFSDSALDDVAILFDLAFLTATLCASSFCLVVCFLDVVTACVLSEAL